jgi:HPt (histidine-containing phosphotransfer) domain-containing protein
LKRYLQSATGKLHTLRTLWAATDSSQQADKDALIHFAHKLAGSGGSYGFFDLSEAAREFEVKLQSDTSEDWSTDQELIRRYDTLINELRALVRRSGEH